MCISLTASRKAFSRSPLPNLGFLALKSQLSKFSSEKRVPRPYYDDARPVQCRQTSHNEQQCTLRHLRFHNCDLIMHYRGYCFKESTQLRVHQNRATSHQSVSNIRRKEPIDASTPWEYVNIDTRKMCTA